ncbi:MAG: cation:proton antiporter [Candidatus Eisenbacteria bacterium]
MNKFAFLADLVVIFAVALIVVAALRRLKLPAIAGFILAGVLVGPHAFRLIADSHDVEVLAEIGVVLLLFGIGLELSLERVRRLWQPVLVGGALQVGLTLTAAMIVARASGLAVGPSIFLGCLVAVSSTAVVLRGLASRGELDAPHGRFALGILIFQDMAVVPMALAIPLLAGVAGARAAAFLSLATGVAVLGGVLILSLLVVPRLLDFVARTRQRDLFVLAVFLICFGTAYAVSAAGISLALGAFLAGLVVSGSEYRHQAMAELIPLREVLASIFFVSVGMLLDPRLIVSDATTIAGLFAAIVLGKALLVTVTALALRLPPRTALLTGTALAQVGEFAFVLMRAAAGKGLLPAAVEEPFTVAVILSMAVTPLLLAAGPHIAVGADRLGWVGRRLDILSPEEAVGAETLSGHVVIVGYGLGGREVARALRKRGFTGVVLDLNPENVRRAAADGLTACYGDVTSDEVLEKLGIHHARALVVSVNDTDAAIRGVRTARRLSPGLRIIGRTAYASDANRLRAAGADFVVAAESSAAADLREAVLAECRTESG